ncbi:MAG: hypothetical protein ACE5DO_08735, partial [Desulfobacterales bacterium]
MIPLVFLSMLIGTSSEAFGSLPEPGIIHGQKYEDTNGNGRHDYHEPYLNGWTIFLDENENGYLDKGEQSTITGNKYYSIDYSKQSPDIELGQKFDGGYYWFMDIQEGDYTVCEVLRDNWVQTQPGTPYKADCYKVTIDSKNQGFDGLDFGNYEMGAITGQKYEDINGNGQYDYGEPSLEGWTIFLDENGNGYLDKNEKSTVTHSDYPGDPAHYEFRDLLLGDYRVCEVLKDNWVQTQPGFPNQTQCYDETIDFSGEICAYHDFGNLYVPKGKANLTVIKNVINNDGGTA